MVFVHGDDFVSAADDQDLRWLQKVLESKLELKTKIVGHEEGDDKSVKILNRIITATEEGFAYEPDIHHVELVIEELGLQKSNLVATLWVEQINEPNADEDLDAAHAKKYQSRSARINFLALDRFDIKFSSKECSRKMSCPIVGDRARL